MTHNDEVLEALHALMSRFKAHMHHAPRDRGGGIGPMEARALGYFARHPGSSASDLVAHSGRDKAQITRLVQLLLERGLLVREPDPADGRRHRLVLTDAGRAAQRATHKQRLRFAAALTADLSQQEQEQLLGLLRRMLDRAPS